MGFYYRKSVSLGPFRVNASKSGVGCSLGTGFSDKERQDPPPVGASVTFQYQELSDGGVPVNAG